MHSQEQLDHAIHKAVKRARREGLIGYVVLLLGVFGMYQNGQSVSNKERKVIHAETQLSREALARSGNAVAISSCNRDFKYAQGIQGILTASRAGAKRQYEQGLITKSRYDEINTSFTAFLSLTAPPDCRDVARIISDDPNNPIVLPDPLYESEKKGG